MSFTTISVIGLGYIGLPTAAAFASRQKQVIGVDINQHAVDTINRGEIHIVEPALGNVVKMAVEGGFLRATTTPVEADAYLIAVPTPFKGDHDPDMAYVEAAAKSIAPVLKKGTGDSGINIAGRRNGANGWLAGRDAPGSDLSPAGGRAGRREYRLLSGACAAGSGDGGTH